MVTKAMRYLGIGLAVAVALGVAATRGYGEITVTGTPKSPAGASVAEGKGPVSEVTKLSVAMWVQCWQHGIKIIDEKDIYGIRLQNLIERETVGFKGRSADNGEVYVIPVNDNSTCLVKPLR